MSHLDTFAVLIVCEIPGSVCQKFNQGTEPKVGQNTFI